MQDENADNGEITGDPVATLNSANSFTKTGLVDGYYLIVDTTANLPEGDMLSRYIVQVSGTTEIAPKKSTVEEDKEITTDEHDTNNDGTSGDDISADHTADDVSIGEKVTYTIDAKIPLSAADYDTFFFIINDTLSNGLTLLPDTINVYVDEVKDANKLTAGTEYTVLLNTDSPKKTTDPHTFEVPIIDAKARAGHTIYVVYQALLNEEAEIGEIPNTNKTTVTYSNNPEQVYDGKDKDKDGKPDDMTEKIYGESPERETKTFTSSIQILKVDEQGVALQGAEFQITGTGVKTVLVTTDEYTVDAQGTYYKLKDGTYTTTAPGETDTYRSVGKIDRSDEGGYVKVGDSYRVATYDELKDTSIEKFIKVTATKDQYESTTTKYKKEKKTTPVTKTESVNVKAFVDEHGIVKFDGLGAGTYTIKETTIPAGYNGIPDFTVTLTFDNTDGDRDTENNSTDADALVWKATSNISGSDAAITEIDSNNDKVVDTFQIEVENKSGSTLPSTGGIGTTLFYIGGGILVVLAVVMLVTKRRMSSND